MPGELALLPVIESAFQPHAVSPANAAGIWQFIPATGHHYGLKRSTSYDGRRDIYASTRAAIKYLKKLHDEFNGDWFLAIAGYNCGEGAVARAIQRNIARGLPTDFWSLSLPQETRTYVPRLLAVAKLFSESEQYGISLRPIPNKALYKTVVLKDQVDLALAANAADMSLDKLFELNPGFKRQRVDVNGSYRLFIPAHKKIVDFHEDLARQMAVQTGNDQPSSASTDENSTAQPTEADTHTPVNPEPVKSSDSPSAIPKATPPDVGAQAPMPIAEPVKAESEEAAKQSSLQTVNEQNPVQPVVKIKLTDEISRVPVDRVAKSEVQSQIYTVANETQQSPNSEPFVLAQIDAGDSPAQPNVSVATYERIATAVKVRHHPSPQAVNIAIRNSQDEPSEKHHAKPVERETVALIERESEERNAVHGKNKQVLKNRQDHSDIHKEIEPNPVGKKSDYVVHAGDTLHSIAQKYDMDVDDLKKMNHVEDADDIKWGQSMKVVVKDAGKKLTASKTTATAYKTIAPNGKYKAHHG